MTRKEFLYLSIISLALLSTFVHLTGHDCYDCNQPLFSNTSTCSVSSEGCVNGNNKIGIRSLWNYFASIKVETEGDGYKVSCAPDCAVELDQNKYVESVTAPCKSK